ncbi:MAG TPA: type II toxin-antitoxin system RelE/ParE family toxin [Roseateles sp.]
MPLAAHARLQAAQSFIRDVRASGEFMQRQDGATADARYEKLLSQLDEARQLLRWNPGAGRPARFLQAQSFQGRALAERARSQAEALGLPDLRELIIKPYVLLYAHGPDRVVLLALKHERQLSFSL